MSGLPGRSAIGAALRRVRAGVRGCAIVLTYHRVADLESDPSLLAVGIERFAEQVRVLARDHVVLSARDLLALMRERRPIPRRAVVLTLDDGYADTLTAAKPVLAEHGVPATAFVPAEILIGRDAYWWDELEAMLLAPGELPERLEVVIRGERLAWQLDGDRAWDDAEWSRRRGWNVTMPPSGERQRIFLTLVRALRPLAATERRDALAALAEQTRGMPRPRRDQRRLDADGLRQLESGGLFEIGGHTLHHPLLSALGPEQQRDEIESGKSALEDALGHPIHSFSYPHGDRDSYDATSREAVRDAGFDGGFTTRFGIVLPWMDPFTVPRCHTEDISGDAFRRLLDGWFDAAR